MSNMLVIIKSVLHPA